MSTKQNSSSAKHTTHHKHHNLKIEAGKVATKAYSALHDFTSGIKGFFRGYINSLSDGIDYIMSDGLSGDMYSKPGKKKTVARAVDVEKKSIGLKSINAKVARTKLKDSQKQ